jgi:transposase InsO family protein
VRLLRLPRPQPQSECLCGALRSPHPARVIAAHPPLGERHLRRAIDEFVVHYHSERSHQGLANVIPFPSRDRSDATGRICARERLGGLLKFYERKAA